MQIFVPQNSLGLTFLFIIFRPSPSFSHCISSPTGDPIPVGRNHIFGKRRRAGRQLPERSTSYKKDHGCPYYWALVRWHDLPYFTCAPSYPLFVVTSLPLVRRHEVILRSLGNSIAPYHHLTTLSPAPRHRFSAPPSSPSPYESLLLMFPVPWFKPWGLLSNQQSPYPN